jgi:chromate transporter
METIPVDYGTLTPPQKRQRLQELAYLFLRLGLFSFGGPAAHTAMMEEEVVRRQQWLSHEKFLDLIGVTNLIPGPNSTELAIHLGYERGKWAGLIIGGVAFILPAMVVVWLLAIAYVHYQSVPAVGHMLYGIQPMIIPLIGQALWKLGRKALKNPLTIGAAVLVMVGTAWGKPEILLLLLAGLALVLIQIGRGRFQSLPLIFLPLGQIAPAPALPVTTINPWSVFGIFLKIGCLLYGGGYVLFAFLQADLVERLEWLTSQQLLDAIAIGQITPGPLFTTATFIGYLLAGNPGAIAATVGIFLPSFLLVALVNPWVSTLQKSLIFRAFLDGVNAGAWGLMVVTTIGLARSALIDPLTICLAVLGAIALGRFSISSHWLVVFGALVGLVGQSWSMG